MAERKFVDRSKGKFYGRFKEMTQRRTEFRGRKTRIETNSQNSKTVER
jgi:hypothetical protein